MGKNYAVLSVEGHEVLIDRADLESVAPQKWHIHAGETTNYVYNSRGVSLQRFLTGLLRVDHRNGNGLDNRRENLRACTQQ